ncbi:hypothetical protein CPT_Muenster_484 [Klebsiella phage Muenster]|nr:hypothetical protein CPT_Muenster_484 [Klebsiella phage Muenster]
MDSLATLFKLNTSEKEGYLSISDLENTSEYIFKNTIKIKANKDKSNTHFTKWIAYWEGVNFAVEMTVLPKVLSTGFVKVVIIDKNLRPISEIGEYPVKGTKVFGTMINNKFMIEKTKTQYINQVISEFENKPKPKTKSETNEEYVNKIKEAWGLK